tara:strand:+ start:551 stop:1021 length:471 start_codon:yes stop_codon:yes gene_type:complete
MPKFIYEDFISKYYNDLVEEDVRLCDLHDKAKDEAVYIWLNSHKSWFEDIYPYSLSRGVGKIATEMLFGKTPSANKIVSNLFVAMAEDADDDCGRDEKWWSEALECYLDDYVNLGNFADHLREEIYLYLELTIEEHLFQEMADIEEMDKWERYDEC